VTLTLDSMTLKTFTAVPTHMININAAFHWYLSTKCKDIASREIGVNGRTTDGRPYTDGYHQPEMCIDPRYDSDF